MESPGAAVVHKLSGTSGSRVGTESLPQVTSWCISSATAGQLYSSSIHQQPGGNCVTCPYSPGEVHMAVGTGERSNDHGPTYTWGNQYDSGQRVKTGGGQIRLDAIPQCVPEDQPSSGSTGSGPIWLQTNPSVATVLQLETRPAGGSSKCFPVGLEQGERLCQPSMVSDRSCPQKDQNTASISGPGSPSLEEPGMVSSSPGDVDGLPSPHSTKGGLVAEGTGSQRDGHNPSTSRLACLREKYRGDSLSTEASELMLASWRTKSS